jgi:hypothetical protein
MGVNVNKDEGDAVRVLCGDQVPGSITYTYSLAGTVLQDIATASGLIEYSWENEGASTEFTFVPATGAASIAGTVIMDPLPLGTSDGAYGDVLTSDFEWSCAGKPDVTWALVAGAEAAGAEPAPKREPVAAGK